MNSFGFMLGATALVLFTVTDSSTVAMCLYSVERGAVMVGSIGGYEANKLEVASPARVGMLQGLVNGTAIISCDHFVLEECC
jgi:hypothetical protein